MVEDLFSNQLQQALVVASEGGSFDAVMHRLATDDVFVPVPGEPMPGGDREVPPGTAVTLGITEAEDGGPMVPAFTSLAALDRGVPGEGRYVRATGGALATAWPPGHGLVLDPGGDPSVAIPEDTVRALPRIAAFPNGGEVSVGEPADDPEELWDLVREWAVDEPEVLVAYRAIIQVQEPGHPAQLVVGLELAADADVGRLLKDGEDAVDREALFLPVDPTGADPLAAWMVEQSTPVYTRDAV
jgi:hypothetical protein